MAVSPAPRPRLSRLALRLGLAIGVLLLVFGGLLWWRMDAAAERLLSPLRWVGEVEYERVYFGLDGEVRIEGLRIVPYGSKHATDAITAERATISTPGLGWLANAAFGASSGEAGLRVTLPASVAARLADEAPTPFPPASRIGVTLENLSFGREPPAIPGAEWLGFASAAPFETLGCGSLQRWTRADLKAMSLPENPSRVHFEYEATSPELVDMSLLLETEGVSSAELSMRLKLEDATRLLDSDWSKATTLLRRWKIRDQGFVRARNWYCARRAGTSRLEFLERHLSALRGRLLTHGIVPTSRVIAAYRRYAEMGGEMSWDSRPLTTVRPDQLVHYAPADQVRMMNATLKTRGGPAVPFELEFVAPVSAAAPPPTVEAQAEALHEAERAAIYGGAAGVPPQLRREAATGGAATGETAAQTAAARDGAVATVTPAASPAPATTPAPAGAGEIASATPTPAAVEAAPTPAPVAAPTPVVATAKPAPAPTPAPTAKAPLPRGELRYDDLARFVGRSVTVRTIFDSNRTGVLISHNPQALTLRLTGSRERNLELLMPRKTVRSARAAQTNGFAGDRGAEKN